VVKQPSKSIAYPECSFVALINPACKAHAPYCYVWHVRLYNIFPLKSRISKQTFIEHKNVCFDFLYSFPIIRRNERYVIKNTHESSCKVCRPGSVVCRAPGYGLDGPGIESRIKRRGAIFGNVCISANVCVEL